MIAERIEALRAEMKKRNIDMYIIPTSDFHESEYVGDYFKARKYITGFTGSAGVAVVTMTEAGLWTDGRYFIQAEKQLAGTPVTLFKMGEEGVPTVREYVEKNLKEGACLGFDGRVINAADGARYEEIVAKKNICNRRFGRNHLEGASAASNESGVYIRRKICRRKCQEQTYKSKRKNERKSGRYSHPDLSL